MSMFGMNFVKSVNIKALYEKLKNEEKEDQRKFDSCDWIFNVEQDKLFDDI